MNASRSHAQARVIVSSRSGAAGYLQFAVQFTVRNHSGAANWRGTPRRATSANSGDLDGAASVPLRAHVLRPGVADQQSIRVENRFAGPVGVTAPRVRVSRVVARIGDMPGGETGTYIPA